MVCPKKKQAQLSPPGQARKIPPPQSDLRPSPVSRGPFCCCTWVGWWALFSLSFVLAGGLMGAVLFLWMGALTHPELEVGYRMSKGFLNGAHYFGIWAGGLGIVLCWIKAHREGRFL